MTKKKTNYSAFTPYKIQMILRNKECILLSAQRIYYKFQFILWFDILRRTLKLKNCDFFYLQDVRTNPIKQKYKVERSFAKINYN